MISTAAICDGGATTYVLMFPTNYQCGIPYTYGTIYLFNPNTECDVSVNVTTPLLSVASGGIATSANISPNSHISLTVAPALMLTGSADQNKGLISSP